jgi:hypothetical protein
MRGIWLGSIYCQYHFFENIRDSQKPTLDLQDLAIKFRTRTMSQWTVQESLKEIMEAYEKIQKGKASPAQLLFLDLEYDTHSKRIHEIGICNGLGDTIVDCQTTLSQAELQRTGRRGKDPVKRAIAKMYETAVHTHQTTDGRVDCENIVQKLLDAGITHETRIIVWATNYSDYVALNEWFEAEGHRNILPPSQNCLTPLFAFKKHLGRLENGKQFPCSLPILFPVIYGEDNELSGRNHHAIVDTLQLRLVFLALHDLCKQESQRTMDWNIEGLVFVQRRMTDFWKLSEDCVKVTLSEKMIEENGMDACDEGPAGVGNEDAMDWE